MYTLIKLAHADCQQGEQAQLSTGGAGLLTHKLKAGGLANTYGLEKPSKDLPQLTKQYRAL